MRALRILVYIALAALLFLVTLIVLGTALDFLAISLFGSLGRNANALLTLVEFGLALLVAVVVLVRLRRVLSASSQGRASAAAPNHEDTQDKAERTAAEMMDTPTPLNAAPSERADTAGTGSIPEVPEKPAASSATTPAGDRAESQPDAEQSSVTRLRPASTPVLIVAALLLLTVGIALGAFAISSRGESQGESATALSSASPSPLVTPDAPAQLSKAEELKSYFNDVEFGVRDQGFRLTWQWERGGWHRGTLFGPKAGVDYSHDYPWWATDRDTYRGIASTFEDLSMYLGGIEPPSAMRAAHKDFVRAVRIEARRWKRFDAVVRPSSLDARWDAFYAWERWSETAFKTQKRHLDNWVFNVRVQSRKHGVALPNQGDWGYSLKSYVQRVEKLVQ